MRRIINTWKPTPAGILIREYMKTRGKTVADIVGLVGGNPAERRRQIEAGRFCMRPHKYGILVKALCIDRDDAVRAGIDSGILKPGGTVAAQIRNARIMCGMTKDDLSERSGCYLNGIKQWEAGKRVPNYRSREALSQALGVQIGTRKQVKDATTFQAKFVAAMSGDGTALDAAKAHDIPVDRIYRLFSMGSVDKLPIKVKREHAVRLAESIGGGLKTEHELDAMFEACDSMELADPAAQLLDAATALRNKGLPLWVAVAILREVYDQ